MRTSTPRLRKSCLLFEDGNLDEILELARQAGLEVTNRGCTSSIILKRGGNPRQPVKLKTMDESNEWVTSCIILPRVTHVRSL